ncbi:MAG: ComEC/Rec2 family competence protein [Chloroflexota bacterium]
MVTVVRIAALPFAAVALPELAVPAGAAVLLVAGVLAWLRWRSARPKSPRRTRIAPAKPPAKPPSRRMSPIERLALGLAAIAVAVTAIAAADVTGRSDRLVMLDVGQGDAILVESADGGRMLVDGGPDPDRVLAELDAVVPPWDRRLDIVVLTHPHEDHVAGLVRVLERYRVGRVFEPGMRGQGPGWAAWDRALQHGPPRATLAAGATLRLGDVTLEVRWPEPGTVPLATGSTGTAINDTSIVLLGTASGRRFLLTGDAEEDVDPGLLAGGLPRLDVLKVAHHGSATATTAALLEATRPAIALISGGTGNDYGHPAPSTLARLRDAGATVYRTDRDGRIELDLRAGGVDVHTGSPRPAATPRTGYDRSHDRPGAPRGRPPAALARTARLVPRARVRGGRRRWMAGAARRSARRAGAPGGHRSRGAAARRRQAAQRWRGPPPAPRRGLGGLAGGAGAHGARADGAGPPGDPAR